MSVSVAEYLGQRTDVDDLITPVDLIEKPLCPFMDRACDKANKKNPLPPVCSVRRADGTLWIVCEHRLCSTRQKKQIVTKKGLKNIPNVLTEHQKDILRKVGRLIYQDSSISDSDIGIRREVKIPLPNADPITTHELLIDEEQELDPDAKKKYFYHADYVMRNFSGRGRVDEVLLEMQGGGETGNTGLLTTHVNDWAKNAERTNKQLRKQVQKVNTLETNAWRRQQEQFLVKGNVVDQTGGKIVFAVGSLLYDYLYRRFKNANLRDLKAHNWTLCILAFKEDTSGSPMSGPIPLIIDPKKVLFTNYSTFVRFLTDQGAPCPELFEGEFLMLDNSKIIIEPTS